MFILENYALMWILQLLILLTALSVGRSILQLKIRKEENKRKELELAIMEKRTEILATGKKIAQDLEEAIFKARVQQEIDNIIRKDDPQ